MLLLHYRLQLPGPYQLHEPQASACCDGAVVVAVSNAAEWRAEDGGDARVREAAGDSQG